MFSSQTRQHFALARGYGLLDHPTHQGRSGEVTQGPFFEIQLRVSPNSLIQALGYACPRCVPAIACGSLLHERLVGRPLGQELTVEEVVLALGGLPPQRSVYAWLAVEAFRQARCHPLSLTQTLRRS